MSTVAKLFVVINLLLAVAFLGAAATFLGYVDSFKGKLEKEQAAHAETQGKLTLEKADHERETTALKGQVVEANDRAGKAEAARAQIATAYAQEKEQYDIVNSSLQKATSALVVAQTTIKESGSLVQQLQGSVATHLAAEKTANDARDAAIRAANASQVAQDDLKSQVQDLQTKLNTSEGELQRTNFRLTSIIKQNPGIDQGAEQPAQSGKVLASDNRANIVVISLGQEDGVKAGFRYTVSRGSSYIATIEITDVEAKKSAGRAIRDISKGPVNVGDDVTSR